MAPPRPHRLASPVARRLAALTALAACQPVGGQPPACPPPPGWALAPSPAEVPLFDVGDQVVTVERVRSRQRGVPGEPSRSLTAAVEEEVRFALLLQAALDRGLARDPEVVDHTQRIMVRRLLRGELSAYADAPAPADDALRAAYEAHRSQYVRPPRRRLSGLQFGRGETDRQRARQLIAELPTSVPEHFLSSWRRAHPDVRHLAELAARVWWEQTPLAEAIGSAPAARVMATEVGGLVPEVLACPAGFCVVQVHAEQAGRVRDFDEVRDEVRERLEHAHRGDEFERFTAELRAVYPVKAHAEAEAALRAAWGS